MFFSGIAEGADLNTYIMKIRVGKNNYKINIQNNISSYVTLRPEGSTFKYLEPF